MTQCVFIASLMLLKCDLSGLNLIAAVKSATCKRPMCAARLVRITGSIIKVRQCIFNTGALTVVFFMSQPAYRRDNVPLRPSWSPLEANGSHLTSFWYFSSNGHSPLACLHRSVHQSDSISSSGFTLWGMWNPASADAAFGRFATMAWRLPLVMRGIKLWGRPSLVCVSLSLCRVHSLDIRLFSDLSHPAANTEQPGTRGCCLVARRQIIPSSRERGTPQRQSLYPLSTAPRCFQVERTTPTTTNQVQETN